MSRGSRRDLIIACAGLLLALAFLTVDSLKRMELVRAVAASAPDATAEPAIDRASSTGYTHAQHRLILPSGGTDGYHWILQTERMLAGEGLRIRSVEYDNAPAGREVHWSGSVRWWLAGVAWVYQRFHPELTLASAIEHVAPWVNALALALFISLLTPLLALRLGGAAAALCALGFVIVQPVYQFSLVGFLDHHAFAAMSAFGAVVFNVVGGGGWVRDETAHAARRWFIAAAISAGAGLWVSAATIVPVLIGIGAGALASSALAARSARDADGLRYAPELWRVWGVAGCATSLAFYALEYFPSHLGLRLEVNHPLYAIAWLGAGDLLYRVAQWLSQRGSADAPPTRGKRTEPPVAPRMDWRWMALDVSAILLLPAVILVTAQTTFRVSDPFLWALHADHIVEFMNFGRQLSALRPAHMLQISLPIVLLPATALLWQTTLTDLARTLWRVLLIAVLCAGVTFLHGAFFYALQPLLRQLGLLGGAQDAMIVTAAALCCDAAALALLFIWPSRRARPLTPAAQTMIVLALLPTAVVLLLAFQQVRWIGIASTLALATLVTVAAVATDRSIEFEWTTGRRVVAALLLWVVLLPFPLETMVRAWPHRYPPRVAAHQMVARDIAHTLRARLGGQRGVVLSSPTVTSWLVYFGGMQGTGTLYWENIDGLKTAAMIYGAASEERARELIERHGVTHIVIDFGEPFVREYARLARGERVDPRAPLTAPRDAFVLRMLETNTFPAWLKPLPYTPPTPAGVRPQPVLILEVVR